MRLIVGITGSDRSAVRGPPAGTAPRPPRRRDPPGHVTLGAHDDRTGDALHRARGGGARGRAPRQRRPGRIDLVRIVPHRRNDHRAVQHEDPRRHPHGLRRRPRRAGRRRRAQGTPQAGSGPARDAAVRDPPGEHAGPDPHGAVMVPPMPAFYNHPQCVGDIIDHVAMRVLDQFGIEAPVDTPRWSGLPHRDRRPGSTVGSTRNAEGTVALRIPRPSGPEHLISTSWMR